jgi:hypothetical protein
MEMTERKVWFITRPERDPRFHEEALRALKTATNNFKEKWKGNRLIHKKYEQVLSDMGIKRQHISNDGSGGRTWFAMLKTFAYCSVDHNGYIRIHKVGEQILKGNSVFENVKKQILTLQYPNAYFLESGFRPKFETGFKIRPARFLIKLTNQKELAYYVKKKEITYFALTAKKDSQLQEITKKIVQFRKANGLEKLRVNEETAQYDHRERSDKGARDFEKAHSDVAHTFMLICDYTGLVEYIRGDALRVNPEKSDQTAKEIAYYDERYPFNTRYMISLERMAENNGLDVDSYKASSMGSIKPAANRSKTEMKVKGILEDYPNVEGLGKKELVLILGQSLPPRDADRYAEQLKTDESYNGLNMDFVEGYLNERDNLVFEDKTGETFKAIGFDVVMRPKSQEKSNTEIEILLKYGDAECGIIDSKNYKEKFPLSANLASHMASEYIPNYDGYENRRVKFFGYVTASNFSGERNLIKITDRASRIMSNRKIKGIILQANVLLSFLDYCIEKDLSRDERINLFLSTVNNRGYKTLSSMLGL